MQLRKLTEQDFDSDMPLPFLDDPEPPAVKEILTTENQNEKLFREAIADPESPEGRRVLELTNEIENEYVKVIVSTGAKYAEIQNILSNPRNGSFTAYLEWKGLAKSNVYRLINSYNFIVSNGHNKELIESLPIRVLAAAGSPSADPELKEKVAAGEITTIKELEAWKKEAKDLESKLLNTIRMKGMVEKELFEVKDRLNKNTTQQQQAVEKEVNARLKEELKKQQEALQEALRKQEAMVARLEDELTILRPLKRREEEIQQKLKELDEAREEVHRAKARNTLFDAVAKARKSFNDAIYPVVTVAMAPEIYGDTLKKELMDLVEMTENFTYALKQKFNL